MALDPATVIRAGGSALLAVAGVIALALARGDRGAIALGVTFSAYGLQLAGTNHLRLTPVETARLRRGVEDEPADQERASG